MDLGIWRRIYLCPFVGVNFYTKGFTVSFGHRRLGWLVSPGPTSPKAEHGPSSRLAGAAPGQSE
jgi:hypothetical protein